MNRKPAFRFVRNPRIEPTVNSSIMWTSRQPDLTHFSCYSGGTGDRSFSF